MPELPEVETTMKGVAPHISGKKIKQVIIRNPNLRWPIDKRLPETLCKKKLQGVARRGKYLLFEFSHGVVLWHLGMSGSLRIARDGEKPGAHDHVDIVFSDRTTLRFHDPRRFGAVIWTDSVPHEHKLLASLGPEPLLAEFSADYLYQQSRKSQRRVKTWIMDSKVVVGVGNIYANESLFNARIHPLKKANALSRKQCQVLVKEIKAVLSYAIKRGGTTLRDFVGGDGKPGYFAQELSVYGRGGEPCVVCAKPLTEKKVGQRSTVYCCECQK